MTPNAPASELLRQDVQVQHQGRVLHAIRAVRKRCNSLSFFGAAARWTFRAALAAVLLDVVLKLFGVGGHSQILLAVAAGVALAASTVSYFRARVTLHGAAIRADEALRLKERLSSALELSIEHAPKDRKEAAWDTLLLASASEAVQGLRIRDHFPMVWSREARWVWCPLCLLVASVVFLPALDLWTGGGKEALAYTELPAEELTLETLEIAKMAERMTLERQEEKEDLAETSDLVKEIDELAKDMKTGKVKKHEAMADLADLSDRIQERREALENNPQTKTSKFDMNMMPQEMSYLGDASERMMRGEFEDAAGAIGKLEDQLRMGDLSDAKAAKMSKEMAALAKTLDPDSDLAKALSKAAAALKAGDIGAAQMGMQAAQLALAEMQDLKQQLAMLDRASQAVASSQLKLAGRHGKCSSCGSKLGKPGVCSACIGGATCSSCNGSGCGACSGTGRKPGSGGSGQFAFGSTNTQGNGLGGPGRGRGGKAPFAADTVSMDDTTLQGAFHDAPIVGSILVDGPAEKGEAFLKFKSALQVASQRGEEAMEKQLVPISHRNRVRQYFHSLNEPRGADRADE